MDDATGKVLAVRFQPGPEDTAGYMATLRMLVEAHDIPLSLYRDQHGTFQRKRYPVDTRRGTGGQQAPTHLGLVMEELGNTQIVALSPQAKGRIERLWRTFQDRLTSELQLVNAATVEEAAFAVAPGETGSAFRKLDRRLDLNRLFSLRYTRVVANDHNCHFRSADHSVAALKR